MRSKFETLTKGIDKNLALLFVSETKLGDSFPNNQFLLNVYASIHRDSICLVGNCDIYVSIPWKKLNLQRPKDIE